MRRFQSIFLAVWLILPTLLLVSCKKDLPFIDSEDTQSATFSDNGFVQYAWTDVEARFFSLAPPEPLSGGSIVTFRTEGKVYHPIIVDTYKKIAEQNEAHDFVEDLQNMVGTPYWEKAFVYHNRETGQEIALIPLFASDADKISGVISVKREGSDLIISGISRDNLLRSEEGDPSVRLAYADWVLKYQSWMLGTESDTELKEALCGYVERETDTQQTPPPPPDCSWVLVEMCSDDDSQTVWIGGRENIPLHLDHDRDGVINSEDQDWLELIRDTDITQEYWERFVFDWWEDHNQDQDYWDYWDNDDYFNDQYDDFWDDWQDPAEHEGRGLDWGDIWGDIVDFFDGDNPFEWQDGRGHDRGPGDDCDPFDPFNSGGGREVRCDVVYLLYCGQSGEWWTSADIIPCPSCGPQDSDAAEQYFADKLERYINTYDLQDHRSLLNSLIDVADCPVSAPDNIVFECFTFKLATYFEERHPDVTLTAAEQAWLIELPDVLGAIIELSQTTGQGQYSEAQIDNFIEVATNLDLDSETAGWLLERSKVTAEVGDFLDEYSAGLDGGRILRPLLEELMSGSMSDEAFSSILALVTSIEDITDSNPPRAEYINQISLIQQYLRVRRTDYGVAATFLADVLPELIDVAIYSNEDVVRIYEEAYSWYSECVYRTVYEPLVAVYEAFKPIVEAVIIEYALGLTINAAFAIISKIPPVVVQRTALVWNKIAGNSANYANTLVPRSFNLTVRGRTFYVPESGSKHIKDLVKKNQAELHPNYAGQMPLRSQLVLDDFANAVDDIVRQNPTIQWEQPYFSGKWEIIFNQATFPGGNPVIFHALTL